MNRIVHIALKVDNLDETTRFYQDVFGFQEQSTRRTRDHISRHLSDGDIDFTLIRYDDDTESAESKASGEKPCIHHFAIEVEDLEAYTEKIKGYGCQIISDPGVIPVKFRAPGGTVAELVPIGRYQRISEQKSA
jgi:lactoylglutathione lyase